MSEDHVDRLIRDVAASYHEPPEPPREVMWTRIAEARAARPEPRPRAVWRSGWRVAAAAAAVLIVGVLIGRLTAPGLPMPTVVSDPDAVELAPERQVAFRVAAGEHLGAVESMLTAFRIDAAAGRVTGDEYGPTARELLFRTRLLQDSPVAHDLALRTLLEDVELVLAQIARFSGERAGDLEFIDQGIQQRGVLLKLRSAIPAGPPRVAAQGAL